MKLTITSSGIRVGDELRAYVARRLEGLARLFSTYPPRDIRIRRLRAIG
jgi:ribosome-associated translation inhibitor RaiA